MSVVKFNKSKRVVIQNRKISLHFTLIFLFLFSLCFTISSISIYTSTRKYIENSEKTKAEIVSIKSEGYKEEIHHQVLVEYIVNNKKYINELNFYSSSMDEGDIIPIRYKLDNPNNILYAKNEYLMFWSFLGIGVISLIVFVFVLKYYRKLYKKENTIKHKHKK